MSSEVDVHIFSGLFDMTPRRSRDLEGVPRLHKRPGEEPANQATFYVYSICRQYVYIICRPKLLILFESRYRLDAFSSFIQSSIHQLILCLESLTSPRDLHKWKADSP